MKVFMGNGLFMPVLETRTKAQPLTQLRAMGYEICATVLNQHADELTPRSFRARTVIVFGNESNGISPDVLAACDRHLTVPMLNGTDSLNVSIAAGIFGYTYRLQYPQHQ